MSSILPKRVIPKRVKHSVKTQISKNKPKLIQKATSYLVDKAIGSPYVDVVKGATKTVKDKYLPSVGTFAAKRFIRSNYAINKINTIPLLIFSTVLRSIVGFLIFNNVKTGDRYIDFATSVLVTAIITLASPFFYKIAETQSEYIQSYTKSFITSLSHSDNYNYHIQKQMWYKTGFILLIIGGLNFVNITSLMIQETLFHSLVVSWIVEIIVVVQNWRNKLVKLYYGMTYYDYEGKQLTEDNIVHIPLKDINYRDVRTDRARNLIDEYIPASRAQKITIIDNQIYDHYEYKIKSILEENPIVIFE